MSKPQAVFFDTSALLAMFNDNSTEKHIADAIFDHVTALPNISMHTVSACLTEAFYRWRKLKLAPTTFLSNLNNWQITLMPTEPGFETLIFNEYCAINHARPYDFADYTLCRVASQLFDRAHILTTDTDDMPAALSRALETQSAKLMMSKNIELIPFK